MLTGAEHNSQTNRLRWETMTQAQLAENSNMSFGTRSTNRSFFIEADKADRSAELCEFIGTVVSGID